jgi:hypothetical protein
VMAITDPEIKVITTIPMAELSKAQRERHQGNRETVAADPGLCAGLDLTKALATYGSVAKGNRRDSMRAALLALWLGQRGAMTKGDLHWCAEQLDADTGYFATGPMKRNLTKMVDWIAREISPFPLPVNREEQVARAMTWAQEHVEPLKRQRKNLVHRHVLDSAFISGPALRKYGKKRDEYSLGCAIAAVFIKHGIPLNADFIGKLVADVEAYFNGQDQP